MSGLSELLIYWCFSLLGDFAVLVKAGMTVKQAITYNMVSAVISYMGMIVGILIGSNEASILWVLALTAGMFLYISLVDMVSWKEAFAQYRQVHAHFTNKLLESDIC